jgi:hypothetical protein
MESELFGHSRGAFTGASESTLGRVNQADGGTLFLDEIGDFPLILQPKLLRFIQDKEYERVGDPVTRRADVRILAATNLNLEDMVRDGRFREDLLYRLNVITLHSPPLRERRRHPDPGRPLPGALRQEYARPARGFSDEAREALLSYRWPATSANCVTWWSAPALSARRSWSKSATWAWPSTPVNNAPRIGAALSLDELEKAHIGAVLATATRWTKRRRPWASTLRPCTANASSTTCEPPMKLAMTRTVPEHFRADHRSAAGAAARAGQRDANGQEPGSPGAQQLPAPWTWASNCARPWAIN